MVLLMKSVILTGAFLSIARSHALSQPPRHIKNGTRIAAWTMKSVEVLGLSCTAISEWIHPYAHTLGCSNVFTDSNDNPAPDDESHVWAANNEGASNKLGSCVGIWIELEMPEVLTVDVVAYRQRYYPADQGDEMDVTMKSSSGAVLSTQTVRFTSVNTANPHEEAFSLTPTAGVKYIRFTYTKADTADCSNTGGYLGAKRIKVYSAAPLTTTPPPTPPMSTGASSGASAVGDPHLQNVYGQRFDLMKEGKHVLIDIPRGVSAENALLRVQADARRLGGHCADMYFQEVNVTGSWAQAKQAGGYHYSVSQNVGETREWTAFGKVELKVVHGRTRLGLKYLNLYVKHLKRAGFAVGGLLGEDDHGDVSQVPAACHQTMALVTAPRYSDVF